MKCEPVRTPPCKLHLQISSDVIDVHNSLECFGELVLFLLTSMIIKMPTIMNPSCITRFPYVFLINNPCKKKWLVIQHTTEIHISSLTVQPDTWLPTPTFHIQYYLWVSSSYPSRYRIAFCFFLFIVFFHDISIKWFNLHLFSTRCRPPGTSLY